MTQWRPLVSIILACVAVSPALGQPRVDAQGDPLPEGAVLRIGSTRYRSGEPQYFPTLSPDEKLLATSGARTITIWEVETGRRVRTVRADVSPVATRALAFSPDGKRLAYLAKAIVAVFVLDLASGQVATSFGPARPKIDPDLPPAQSAHKEEFLGIGFTPNGELRAFSTDRVVTWDLESGRMVRAFDLPGRGYDMSADGNRIVAHSPAGSGEKTGIALYDGAGKRLTRVPIEAGPSTTVATISADARSQFYRAASVSDRGTVSFPPTR